MHIISLFLAGVSLLLQNESSTTVLCLCCPLAPLAVMCAGLGSLRCPVGDLGMLLGSTLIRESGPPGTGRGKSSLEVQL